jgi:hypothetical protein
MHTRWADKTSPSNDRDCVVRLIFNIDVVESLDRLGMDGRTNDDFLNLDIIGFVRSRRRIIERCVTTVEKKSGPRLWWSLNALLIIVRWIEFRSILLPNISITLATLSFVFIVDGRPARHPWEVLIYLPLRKTIIDNLNRRISSIDSFVAAAKSRQNWFDGRHVLILVEYWRESVQVTPFVAGNMACLSQAKGFVLIESTKNVTNKRRDEIERKM